MPSFVCDVCQETLKKVKLDSHKNRCQNCSFSCIDCYKSFKGVSYRAHTSCITEVEKYHGKKANAAAKAKPEPEKANGAVKAEPEPKKARLEDFTMEHLLPLLKTPTSLKGLLRKLKEKGLKRSFEKQCLLSVQNGNISISFNNHY